MNANELAKGLSQNQIYGDDYGLFNKRIQNMLRQQQAEIEALKANFNKENPVKEVFNNEPVAWLIQAKTWHEFTFSKPAEDSEDVVIEPLYTHPAKTQLSNGHLSDCAIHNEPASRNKDCNCGFEPKFDLSGLKHEDNCRYFDDELYCSCGADTYALVEWYRHKEITHPAKTLTDEEIKELAKIHYWTMNDEIKFDAISFARAILRKAQNER